MFRRLALAPLIGVFLVVLTPPLVQNGPAAQTVPITTLGENLVDRPQNDTFAGNVYVASSPPFGVSGRVVTWRFFDNDSPPFARRITPLLLELTAANEYTVRGIGQTQVSDGSGLQEFEFGTVAGSSDVVLPNYHLGWKDGSPDNDPENVGVIDNNEFLNAESLTFMAWGFAGGGPQVIQDEVISNGSWNFRAIGGRDYSVQFDVLIASDDGRTFVDRQIIASTTQGLTVATGDFDGDGDPDVVVGTGSSDLFWLENDAGSFSPTQNVIFSDPGSGRAFFSVVTADVDNDGDVDVVSGSRSVGTIEWWINDGSGNFSSSSVINFNGVEQVRLGDLGNDGDLDAFFHDGDGLGFNENTGTATAPSFSAFSAIDSASFKSMELGNVGPDAFPDVLVTGEDDAIPFVRWYVSTGGVFNSSGFTAFVSSAIPVDLDGDGDLDIAAGADDGSIFLAENDLGSFFSDISQTTGPGSIQYLTSADIDLDGDQDLLGIGGAQVFWMENLDGGGHFGPPRDFGNLDANVEEMVTLDADGDGDLDVLTVADENISLYRNRTVHRTLLYPEENEDTISVETAEPFANRPVLVGDLDGDGDLDIVVGESGGTLPNRLYLNDGTGSFASSTEITADLGSTQVMVLLDADGDQDLDLATVGTGNNRLYLNDGDGDPFDTLATGLSFANPGGLTFDARAGDIDLDGDLDLITGNAAPSINYWYANLGGGVFASGSPVGSADADPTFGIALGDIDGDGDLDAVAANFSIPDKVYMNDGVGDPWDSQTSGSPIPTPIDDGSVHCELGDIDGDGDLDLLVSNHGVVLYRNPGNTPADTNPFVSVIGEQIVSTLGQRTLRLADADRDGDLDLFLATSTTDRLYLNDGNGFGVGQAGQPLGGQFISTQDIALGDMDGDGDLDAVATSDGGDLTYLGNAGGQYILEVTDIVPGTIREGQRVPVFELRLTSRARLGDSSIELARLDVEFSIGESPVSTSTAALVFDALEVYRDQDGDRQFDEAVDELVASEINMVLSSGRETLILPDDDPDLRVALPASFFVVLKLTDDAASNWPLEISVYRPRGTLRDVEDGNSDVAVIAEPSNDLFVNLPTPSESITADAFVDVINVGDEQISLREAVIQANAAPGDAVILLRAGTYLLTIPGINEDAAATGDLDLTNAGNMTIIGEGADVTTIDAAGLDRVFHVLNGNVRFEGVTITGGDARAPNDFGGGIHVDFGNDGTTVVDCAVTLNTAGGRGSAIALFEGDLWIEGSTISQNSGPSGPIQDTFNVGGDLTIVNSTIANNGDNSTLGCFAIGSCSIFNTTIADNLGFGINGHTTAPGSLTSTITTGNGFGDIVSGNGFTSGGFNFIGNNQGASGFVDGVNNDQVGGNGINPVFDPLLGPLQDNGGTTLTKIPLEGSPVIDTGTCAGTSSDQRGFPRPNDIPDVPTVPVGDECDIGAVEATFLESANVTLAEVEVPIRWCAVRGAPSVPLAPGGAGEDLVDALLLDRLQRVNKDIFGPTAKIRFRSGATTGVTDFPLLDDPDTTVGVPGDVMIDPTTLNFDEFQQLIATCRSEWEASAPDVTGVTAVSIGRFVDPGGQTLKILGLGGRAPFGNAELQAAAGRVMVIDPLLTLSDLADTVLGHELGHALALAHGNGLDDDGNGFVDDNDEQFATPPLPRFDGLNLMQYRKGKQLSINQIALARFHALGTINDVGIEAFQAVVTDDGTINADLANILDFGLSTIAEADLANILDFDLANILDFDLANILDFDLANILDFEYMNVVDFGITEDNLNDTSTLFTSSSGVLWPKPVRPNTDYYFFVNVDPEAAPATGALPSAHGFPGAGVAVETDIDLILQVNVSAVCPDLVDLTQCVASNTLAIFQWDGATFQEVTTSNTVTTPAQVEDVAVGLIVDNGGEPLEFDEQRIAVNVEAVIDNNVLRAAGWADGNAIRLEALTEVDCVTPLPNGSTIDCQCTDCALCPEFPECNGNAGDVPATIPPELIVDCASALLEVVEPTLPECVVTPVETGPGGTVTVEVSNFPTSAGDIEISLEGAVLASSPLQPDGSASIPVVIPANTIPGDRVLRALIPIRGTEDFCAVRILGNPCAVDGEGPLLTNVPAPLVVELTTAAGTPVSVPLPDVSDTCDAAPLLASDAPAVFPLGVTTVTFTATDASGNSSQATTTVTVQDTTSPTLNVSVSPDEMWPPNHKMKGIDVTISATDLSGAPLVRLQTIVSNEADNGPGDGNTDDDIQINVASTVLSRDPMQVQVGLPYAPSMQIKLRAERQGSGNGRLYTLTFSATDGSGNVTTKVASVLVPHDRSGIIEPVTINLLPGANGSIVSWNSIAEAQHYNVIRARLSQIDTSGPAVNLGSVQCLAGSSTATTLEDAAMLPPALTCTPGEMCLTEAFVYLVEYNDGSDSGYGTERAGKPRLAAIGDCP